MARAATRRAPPLPDSIRQALRRACRLEWLTLALRLSAVVALYFALGGAQSLTAVWLKSLWSLLPPIAFLSACRVERRAPTPRFPYGFYRAGSIAFLAAALALTCMGLYLCYAGMSALVQMRHPSLPPFDARASLAAWPGWLPVGALLYSIAVPWITGGSRQSLAITVHDKGLYADASMGRAGWLAGSAAVVGLLGIGMGYWWADFVATLVIGLDILRHGIRHLNAAVCDLIDEIPRRIGSSEVDPLGTLIRDHLESLDWIGVARVRLREEGRLFTGVGFVRVAHDDALVDRLDAAREQVERMDWRLLDFEIVPVTHWPRHTETAAE